MEAIDNMGASGHITFVKIHSFYGKNLFFLEFYWGRLSNLNPSTDHRPPLWISRIVIAGVFQDFEDEIANFGATRVN